MRCACEPGLLDEELDLLADPHENTNLAAKHPDVVARLAGRIEKWWPATGRQVLTTWTDTPGQWR